MMKMKILLGILKDNFLLEIFLALKNEEVLFKENKKIGILIL
jgi:hypothetical protein